MIRGQFLRGTAAQWVLKNPILLIGELGVETDTHQFKIGDGVTAWNSLAYGGLQGPAGPSGEVTQLNFTVSTDFKYVGTLSGNLIADGFCGRYALGGTGSNIQHVGSGFAGIDSTFRAIGLMELASGTTGTSSSGVMGSAASLGFGYCSHFFQTRLWIPTLASATEGMEITCGLIDTIGTSVGHAHGVYFLYLGDNTSNNLFCVASDNGVRTTVDSGHAMTAGGDCCLGILVDEAGTSAKFFINGSLVQEITTNIPLTRKTSFGFRNCKLAGSASRSVYVDYLIFNNTWSAAR